MRKLYLFTFLLSLAIGVQAQNKEKSYIMQKSISLHDNDNIIENDALEYVVPNDIITSSRLYPKTKQKHRFVRSVIDMKLASKPSSSNIEKHPLQKEDYTLPVRYSDSTIVSYWGKVDQDLECVTYSPFVVHYDKGYLPVAWKLDNDDPLGDDFFSTMIKTDINGRELWQKPIKVNGKFVRGLNKKKLLANNNLLISGIYDVKPDGTAKRFICLLNPCFEVIWAKEFHYYRLLYVDDMAIDNNGDIVVLFGVQSKTTWPYYEDQCMIMKLNMEGEVLYHKLYLRDISKDPVMWNYLYIDSNNNYYITASSWIKVAGYPTMRANAHILKMNEEGEELWRVETRGLLDDILSYRYRVIQDKDNTLTFLGMCDLYPDDVHPYVLKIDKDGHVISMKKKPILENVEGINPDAITTNQLSWVDANKSQFLGSFGYIDENTNSLRNGFLVSDTAINITSYLIKNYDYLKISKSEMPAVNDSKIIYASTHLMPDANNPTSADVRLAKHNLDFTYAEETDDSGITYDSLCPHPIVSGDIINIETEVWEAVAEYGEASSTAQRIGIQAVPNPTKAPIHLQLSGCEAYKNLQLSIFNMQGQQLWSQALAQGCQHVSIAAQSWSAGTYTCIVRNAERKMVGSTSIILKP